MDVDDVAVVHETVNDSGRHDFAHDALPVGIAQPGVRVDQPVAVPLGDLLAARGCWIVRSEDGNHLFRWPAEFDHVAIRHDRSLNQDRVFNHGRNQRGAGLFKLTGFTPKSQ